MSKGRKSGKTGGFVPFLCNLLGTLILLSVILCALPVTVPRFLGYEIYSVVSGSMEPAIPVGSLLYVEHAEPEDLPEGEVIAFRSGNSVVSHRLVRNNRVEGELTTKGDANAGEDLNAVPYGDVIGRVTYHVPVLGRLLFLFTNDIGKLYVICFAASGVMLNLLASVLRSRRRTDG